MSDSPTRPNGEAPPTPLHGWAALWQINREPFVKLWLTNILLGAIVALVLNVLLRDSPLIRYLERAGSDYVMGICASHDGCVPASGKQVAVIELEPADAANDSVVTELNRVVTLLAHETASAECNTGEVFSSPAAIILDIVFELKQDDPPSRLSMAALGNTLKEITSRKCHPVKVVLLPHSEAEHPENPRVQNNFYLSKRWFDDLLPDETRDGLNVRHVIPALAVDSDGVVRSMMKAVCALPANGSWRPVPTLAHAADEAKPEAGTQCPFDGSSVQGLEDDHIVFQAGPAIMHSEGSGGRIPFMRSRDIQAPLPEDVSTRLAGRHVLIGQVSWQDTHATPLGPMPGVLIQANSIATALTHPSGVRRSVFPGIEALAIAVSAFFAALAPPFRALISALAGLALYRHRPRWRYRVIWHSRRHRSWGRCALELVARLVPLAALVLLYSAIYHLLFRSYAEHILSTGIVIGTFVPILATMTELLIDLGDSIVRLADATIDRVWAGLAAIKAKLVPAAFAAIVAFGPPDARGEALTCAQDRLLRIEEAPTDAVWVLPASSGGEPAPASDKQPLKPFDTVQIRDHDAKVRICVPGLPIVTLERAGSHYLVPPDAPPASVGIWQEFFALISSRPETSTQFGATLVTRGGLAHLGRKTNAAPPPNPITLIAQATAGSDVTVPLSGPLRPVAALAAGEQNLDATRAGLALAWLGGKPPYAATIAANGATRTVQLDRPLLWLPDWRMRAPDATVVVQDSDGGTLRTHLTAASPPGPAAETPSQAITLFQTGGETWRLEAFRDLQGRAATDTLASQAVAAIRLSGAE